MDVGFKGLGCRIWGLGLRRRKVFRKVKLKEAYEGFAGILQGFSKVVLPLRAIRP